MSEFVVAILAFLSMMGAALFGLFSKTRLPSEHLQDDTRSVVGLVANLFVVMTALVLGLMLNSAKNTFETNNRDIRTLATELILLDRTMRALGPEAEDARRHLVEYVQTSLKGGNILEEDPQAEASLEAARTSLRAIRFSDEQKIALWNDARQLDRQVIRQRWVVLDEYGGTIPRPLITIVILWLAIIFASFGYGSAQHRRNGFVMPGGIAHLGGHLSNPRYGYAIFQHDPSIERSRSTGVDTIAALKASTCATRARSNERSRRSRGPRMAA